MQPAAPPTPETSWRLGSLVGWLAGLVLAMIVLAWLFVEIELAGYAWLGLLPLLMGVACGLVSGGLIHVAGMPHGRTAMLLTAIAAAGLSVGQHYFHYLEYDRRKSAAVTGQVDKQGLAAAVLKEIGPTGFDKYMLAEARNGRWLFGLHLSGVWSWVLWTCESLLIIVAAVLTVRVFARRPFCPECHRWYCTVRQGQLSGSLPTELAQLAGVPPSGGVLH